MKGAQELGKGWTGGWKELRRWLQGNRRRIGDQEMDIRRIGGSLGLRRWMQGKQVDQRDSGVGYRVVRG